MNTIIPHVFVFLMAVFGVAVLVLDCDWQALREMLLADEDDDEDYDFLFGEEEDSEDETEYSVD